ncbi:MAG: elongation factor G, partial [Phycisphaerales bacterium]|nr:elongation factor G [Phycisphaerales bacterium]
LKREYVAAIESAARSSAQSGPLGSYPLINVRAVLTNAEEHPTDSTEVAFETATSLAVNHALEKAAPVLLEPIMKVEVVTPDEYFGAINSDMMSRRATITGTHMRGQNQVVDCEAPLSAMFGYATAVRSLSQGRASYSMEPCRYEAMPPQLAQKVLGVM